MTTDLEKQFFDTFGIKPKKGCTAYDKLEEHEADTICNDECLECLYFDDRYPQITDHILLKLICILSKYQKDVGSLLEICETDKNSIKEEVLDMLIFRDIALKQQVQALFKEG